MRNSGTIDALGLAAVAGAMIWLLTLCRCTPEPLPPSTHPGCVGACEQGAALGCSWADDGCVAFCDAYHSPSVRMRPWADCVGQAGDVGAVEACGMSCEVDP